jgi:hypothetical protein
MAGQWVLVITGVGEAWGIIHGILTGVMDLECMVITHGILTIHGTLITHGIHTVVLVILVIILGCLITVMVGGLLAIDVGVMILCKIARLCDQ